MTRGNEIGVVSGWRYVVFKREGDGLFCIVRNSPSLADHGWRQEFVGSRPSEKEAVEAG